MKRIAACFARTRAQQRAALVAYITAGDPSLRTTADLVAAIAGAGSDAIELGIPFSDPIADGPTIQRSAQRALDAGATVERVLHMVSGVRRRTDVPLIAMTYCNPVEQYGLHRFARDAKEAGFDGAILTDLPPEEAGEWRLAARAAGLDTIFLAAPTSTAERLRLAARSSTGFLYCISRLGVTGARKDLPPDLEDLVLRARAVCRRPVCVGFGISSPDQVRAVARVADGVVVGSALVNALADCENDHERLVRAEKLVRSLAEATRR